MDNKTCGACIHFDSESNMCCLYYDHFVEAYDSTAACDEFEPKQATNGDKLRKMTNSQLSKFLARISSCSVCFPGNPRGDRKWWYDWTFAPAESEVKDEQP